MPKVVDREQRKRRLADAALAITAESGVNAVTIRAVSEKSGWSTGVLNYYFSSRHELLLSALHRAAEMQGIVFKRILDDKRVSPMERLENLIESVLPLDGRRVALTRVFLMFYAEAMSNSATYDNVKRYLRNWRKLVERTIKEAQASEQIDGGLNPAHSSAELVALSDGLAMHAILDPAVADLVKEYGVSLHLFGRTWALEWCRS